MLTQYDVDQFILALKSKHPVLQVLRIELQEDGLFLQSVLIKKSQRNKGYGHAIMSEITTYANVHQVSITLWVTDIYGSDLKRLFNFYRKNDFFLIKPDQMRYSPKPMLEVNSSNRLYKK